MANHPAWDFWLHIPVSENDDMTRVYLHHVRRIEDTDIRSEDYDVNLENWCGRYFWNAEEAGYISFFRDPKEIGNTEDCLNWHDKDAVALQAAIDDLIDVIMKAQEKQILPELCSPAQYIEWTERVGVDVPPAVLKKVAAEEQLRRLHMERSEGVGMDAAAQSEHVSTNPKALGPKGKLDGSLKSIILALLIKHVGGYDKMNPPSLTSAKAIVKKADLGALARDIAEILDQVKHQKKAGTLGLSTRTLRDHLAGAIGLLSE